MMNGYQFQLVFQFEASTLADYDRFTVLEQAIYVRLRKSKVAKLDGHDCGMNEFNIFIHCNAPEAQFAEVAKFIDEIAPGLIFRAGYRAFAEDHYKVLWPSSLDRFHIA